MADDKDFPNLLHLYREASNLSQMKLATLLNCTPSVISRWETGKRPAPDRDTVLNLAGALGLSGERADDANKLLLAAGYSPLSEEGLDFGNPAVRSVALILTYEFPEPERRLFELQASELTDLWRDHGLLRTAAQQETPRNDDLKEKYIALLDRSTTLNGLIRLLLLKNVAYHCVRQSQFAEAFTWYEQARDAALSAELHPWAIEMMVQMGNAMRYMGERDEALSHYQQAQNGIKEHIKESIEATLGEARCRRKRAAAYLYLGMNSPVDTQMVVDLLEENINELGELLSQNPPEATKIRIQKQLFGTYCYQGWVNTLAGRVSDSIQDRKKALEIAEVIESPYRKCIVLRLLGDDYENYGELDAAEDYYVKASSQYPQIPDPLRRQREEGKVHRGIGRVRANRKDWIRALKHLKNSLSIFGSLKDEIELAWTLADIGKVEAARGNLQRSLDYHTRARSLFEHVGNFYYAANSALSIAEIEYKRGNLDEAWNQALEVKIAAEGYGHARLQARAQEAFAFYSIVTAGPGETTEREYDAFCTTIMQTEAIEEYADKLEERVSHLADHEKYEEAIWLCELMVDHCKQRPNPSTSPLIEKLQRQSEKAREKQRKLQARRAAYDEALGYSQRVVTQHNEEETIIPEWLSRVHETGS